MREDDIVSPSRRVTPMNKENWLNRSLKPILANTKISGVNHQVLRRTFATMVQKCGTVKDAPAQLRHSSPTMTLGVYMQQIPESTKQAVEALDFRLSGGRVKIEQPI